MTYWIVRHKRKGRAKPFPLPLTFRAKRSDSILAATHYSAGAWNKLKRRYGLECVKVRLDTEYYNEE